VRAEGLLAGVSADHPERDGAMVRLPSNDGPRVLIDALRRLDTESLSPATLTVREPTLDDAFLALTGKRCVDCQLDDAVDGGAGLPDEKEAT
jgi:hypothetical protein